MISGNVDLGEISVRLLVALLIGAVIGTQRHLRGQAAGLRTHAMVSLAAAMAVLIVAPLPGSNAPLTPDAQSRVLQGILAGVGFIGGGLILHSARGSAIHGLTSAAVIWIVAVFGALCGHGRIDIALIGFAMVMAVLLFGAPVEDALYKRFGRKIDPRHPPE